MRRIAFALVAGLLLLGSAARAEEPAKLKISFASPYTTFCLPYLVAKDFGWFEKDGLATEDIIVNGDANATRALVTGAVDVAMTGPLNIFNAIESGGQLKWIGSWQPIVDYDVVAGPAIKSMADLADKTFASSGPSGLPQVLPGMLFKKLGIPTDRAKFISVGGHSARLQAVMAGKVDAALVNEITAEVGLKSGQVHIIASVPEYFPDLGYTVLAVRTPDLANSAKRRAFESLMRGSIRGARFVVQNPEKAAAVLHKYLVDLDLDMLTAIIKRLNRQKVWGVDGGADVDVTNFTAQLEYQLGETKTLFKADQVMDTSIVEAALKQEGKF
jgi:NitT/TauT family transport system substrate-binding protein